MICFTVTSDDEPCPVHDVAHVATPVAAPVQPTMPPTPAPMAGPLCFLVPALVQPRMPQTPAPKVALHHFPVASNGKLLDIAIIPTQDAVTLALTPRKPAPVTSNGKLINAEMSNIRP